MFISETWAFDCAYEHAGPYPYLSMQYRFGDEKFSRTYSPATHTIISGTNEEEPIFRGEVREHRPRSTDAETSKNFPSHLIESADTLAASLNFTFAILNPSVKTCGDDSPSLCAESQAESPFNDFQWSVLRNLPVPNNLAGCTAGTFEFDAGANDAFVSGAPSRGEWSLYGHPPHQ